MDMNLLLTLNALLIERNVTRAAERLHLSQPSVSVQLGKLRAAFDDPLLLPGPRGMLPTARALALLEPLQAALGQLAVLFSEHYVLAGRIDHPALQTAPDLDRFCALEFVVVSPNGGGYRTAVDTALAQLGRSRTVVLSVPHFLFVPPLLAASDMVALLPARLLRQALGTLRTWEPPVAIPDYAMAMVWHERLHLEPGHRWLREQVMAAL